MEAKILRDGDILIVQLHGRVNYESVEPFKKTCSDHLVRHRVIFDLRGLSFVGSIGITDLVGALADLTQNTQMGVKFTGVSSEFRRVLQASHMRGIEIYEDSDKARLSFMGYEVPKIHLAPLIQQDFIEEAEGEESV